MVYQSQRQVMKQKYDRDCAQSNLPNLTVSSYEYRLGRYTDAARERHPGLPEDWYQWRGEQQLWYRLWGGTSNAPRFPGREPVLDQVLNDTPSSPVNPSPVPPPQPQPQFQPQPQPQSQPQVQPQVISVEVLQQLMQQQQQQEEIAKRDAQVADLKELITRMYVARRVSTPPLPKTPPPKVSPTVSPTVSPKVSSMVSPKVSPQVSPSTSPKKETSPGALTLAQKAATVATQPLHDEVAIQHQKMQERIRLREEMRQTHQQYYSQRHLLPKWESEKARVDHEVFKSLGMKERRLKNDPHWKPQFGYDPSSGFPRGSVFIPGVDSYYAVSGEGLEHLMELSNAWRYIFKVDFESSKDKKTGPKYTIVWIEFVRADHMMEPEMGPAFEAMLQLHTWLTQYATDPLYRDIDGILYPIHESWEYNLEICKGQPLVLTLPWHPVHGPVAPDALQRVGLGSRAPLANPANAARGRSSAGIRRGGRGGRGGRGNHTVSHQTTRPGIQGTQGAVPRLPPVLRGGLIGPPPEGENDEGKGGDPPVLGMVFFSPTGVRLFLPPLGYQ